MVEKKNILQEKRQERERRKTQEITLLKRTPSQVIVHFFAFVLQPEKLASHLVLFLLESCWCKPPTDKIERD